MAESEQLLSQEEVDAMLAGAAEVKSAPAEAPADTPVSVSATSMEEIRARETAPTDPASATPDSPPTQPAALPAPALPAAALNEGATQETVSQLSERVYRLEAALQQTEQMQQQLQTLVDQLQSINGRVESMMDSLQGTVGFGAHQSFVCRSCQSQGNVAARLNCTACGEENLWGWWPPQEN
jgi:hypothetical protein